MEHELLARQSRIRTFLSVALSVALACALLCACPPRAAADTSSVTLKTYDSATGQTTAVKEFSRDRLAYLASFNGDGSEGGYLFNEKVMAVAQYVLLNQLFEDAGVSFEEGDEVVVSGGGSNAASFTLSYEEATSKHYFYPDYEGNRVYNAEGAVEVPGPGIALAWNTASINAFDGMPTAGYAFDNAYYTAYDSGNVRFFIGLTEDQFLSGNMKGSRLIQWVDSITVVKASGGDPDPGPIDPGTPKPDPFPISDFTDVGLGAGETPHWVVSSGWLARALDAGIVHGYTDANGVPNGLFGPDDKVTRGQLAVMLYRHAHPDWNASSGGGAADANTTAFADNEDGMFYTSAVNWAYEQGILTGSADASGRMLVRPSDGVTREEASAMLYRYAAGCGADAASAGRAAFSSAPDAALVSAWAADAVGWCYSRGVMTGAADTGALAPQSFATRAEMCKMVMATIASFAQDAPAVQQVSK